MLHYIVLILIKNIKDIAIRYYYGHGNTTCYVYTFMGNVLTNINSGRYQSSFKIPEKILNVKYIESSKIEVSVKDSDMKKVFSCSNFNGPIISRNTKFYFWGTGVQVFPTVNNDGRGDLNITETLMGSEGAFLFPINITYTWDKEYDKWIIKDWKVILDDTGIVEVRK